MNKDIGDPLLDEIKQELRCAAAQDPCPTAQFFKRGPGAYAEKEQFLGVRTAVLRKIVKNIALSLSQVSSLLTSCFLEERLLALLVLVKQYEQGDRQKKEEIFSFYTGHIHCVNNWNLVDSSAPYIVGAHLFRIDPDATYLHTLAQAECVWKRRIAMVATLFFIRKGVVEVTFSLADRLLLDREDLIHKAVGWMLREAGKKEVLLLERFLTLRASKMPRTMLRYAMEQLSVEKRALFMQRAPRE